MNTQVFGCPSCQQPFQVSAEFAGQAVQCPACAQAVEIPKDAFLKTQASATSSAPQSLSEQEVFACPACKGQFGITSAMYGQTVGCPHCQTSVVIKPPEQEPEPETIAPEILSGPISKIRRKKQLKTDLFAPGFKAKPREHDAAPQSPEVNAKKPKEPPVPQSRKPDPRFREPKKKRHTEASEHPPTQPIQPTRREEKAKPKRQPKNAPPHKSDDHSNANAPVVRAPNAPAPKPAAATSPDDAQIKEPTPIDAQKDELPDQTTSPKTKATQTKAPESTEPNQESQPTPQPGMTPEEAIGESPWKPDPIDHLLPPRFDVLDPTRISQAGQDQFKVVLPDGKGGIAQLDNRVLRVEHDGEKVALRMLTEKQKQRRRLIQNIIAILIGIAAIAITFTLALSN